MIQKATQETVFQFENNPQHLGNTLFVYAYIMLVCPPGNGGKWEKYAWISQVKGLRGHIIDPFGEKKMTALKMPKLWRQSL